MTNAAKEEQMEYDERIQTKEGLKNLINQQQKVILYGEKSLAVILLRFCLSIDEGEKVRGLAFTQTKSEHIAFDEFVVKPIEEYLITEDSQIIILGRDEEACHLLRERAAGWNGQQICYIDYGLIAELSWEDNVKLDFLCVGFTKCGTTSLYWALRKNKQIYMPKEKEILYGKWKEQYIDAPERFREMYFSGVSKKKKLGCIEPTYFRRANFVYESFGNTPKVLFMLRNPADATYSYFKMKMRRSDDPIHRMYFKKYRKYTPEMFKEYLEDDIFSGKDRRFSYDIWLKEYLKYFDRESIKIIFFEEIIREPQRILSEIQEFIGVEPVKGLELPHSNSGKKVSKNYFCARVNGKLHKKSLKYKESGTEKQRKRFRKIRNFIWKYTLIDNDEKISMEEKTILMEYYQSSIQEIEKIEGRSLKGVWY